MRAHIKWMGKARFSGRNQSGHSVIMDGPSGHGGNNAGFRPMEMLLLGLGGCAAFYLTHILKKSRNAVVDCQVEVSAERDPAPPGLFKHIHLHYILKGENLNPHQVQHALDLSTEKYCSASITLSKATKISHDFEIQNDRDDRDGSNQSN